jgi:hypothetical protein
LRILLENEKQIKNAQTGVNAIIYFGREKKLLVSRLFEGHIFSNLPNMKTQNCCAVVDWPLLPRKSSPQLPATPRT